jgi:hypothetical protein
MEINVRLLIVMLVAVMFMGCNIRTPSERTGYRLACETLRADEDMPKSIEIMPIDDAELYIAKNAGYVVLHYKNGAEESKYVVHLKRVSRTWMVSNSE